MYSKYKAIFLKNLDLHIFIIYNFRLKLFNFESEICVMSTMWLISVQPAGHSSFMKI